MRKLPQVKSGEWVAPRLKGYVMECCDCGLRHRLNFRLKIVSGDRLQLQFQAFRTRKDTR